MKPIVLSLCDRTGNMVQPWLDAGHECWIVDVQHESGEHIEGNLIRVGADVRSWLPPLRDYTAVFAFPPCTDMSVSGARWFKGKGLGALAQAIDIFAACVRICEWSTAPWFVENPVSVISSHYRKPDFTFDPCDYGDPYKKKTCLWTGGAFKMPPRTPVEPIYVGKIHRMPPSPDRGDLRSVTPVGFAHAVYQSMSNGGGSE